MVSILSKFEDAVQFGHDALKNDFLVINKGNGKFYRNLENKGGKELSHLAVFWGGGGLQEVKNLRRIF
jgi:hypothetical protein